MPGAVIETDRLSKTFRGRPAVRHVSLSVSPGSVFAFLGPNGAGKITTIRMLLGLLHPTEGTVRMHGLRCERIERQSWRERGA